MSWKGFERIIEKIHRQWSPNADVRHDERVRGRSGRWRQLDVTVRGRLGPYQIFIVVECKDHVRPVGISQVEAFAKKLEDVGAPQGVMVSRSGFDDGARAIAQQNNIQLLNYREAEDADWTKVLGQNVTLFFTLSELHPEQTEVVCEDDSDGLLEDDALIIGPSGQPIGTVEELRSVISTKLMLHAPFVGPYELIINLQGYKLQSKEGTCGIRTMTLHGRKAARRYFFPPASPSGHVIEDAIAGGMPFAELEQSISWEDIVESNPGQELTPIDFLDRGEPVETVPAVLEWSESDGKLRIVFRRMSSEDD